MRRRHTLALAVALIASSFLLAMKNCRASEPNVVLFFADDLGWSDWQYDATLNPTGSPVYETPNMLRLAQSGVVFNQAYSASPVCSATRASLMTGKTTARTNFTYLAGGNGGSPNTSATLRSPVSTSALPGSEVTLPESLSSAAGGYHTGFIGKWHVGAGPTSHGYDYNIAGGGAGCPCSPVGDGFFAGADGRWTGMPGINTVGSYPADAYLTDVLSDFAEDYIEQRAAQPNPFFLTMSTYQVHVPLDAPQNLINKYSAKIADLNAQNVDLQGHANPIYAAMIEKMDESLGRILDRLEDPNGDGDTADSIRDNTIIMLASDNGGLTVSELGDPAPTRNGPLREGKGSLYEGGIRTPFITSWTGNGNISQGTTSNARLASYDILPTVLDLTGLDGNPAVPTNSNIDGVSFAGALEGGQHDPGFQVWHLPHRTNQDQRGAEQGITIDGGAYTSAIRDEQFKLVYQYETESFELYDLLNDLSETTDLLASLPDKAFELSAELHSYLNAVGPSTPIVKASGLALDYPAPLWETIQGDFDGVAGIDVADWTQLKAGFNTDLTGLSAAEGYALGDINLDRKIDRFDFAQFRTQFDLANGVGAFEAMLAQVPEPATLTIAMLGALTLTSCRLRAAGRYA